MPHPLDTVEYMLTTVDNPHDPFKDYHAWYSWDTSHGYNTLGYLARITKTSEDISETDQIVAINQAIEEIVELNVNGMYRKVVRVRER